jgi:hypothetical protein
VTPDIYPVIGKKRGSDGLDRVFMAGDREKNDPLFIKRKGVGERVKPVCLNGYRSTGAIAVP